LPAKRAILAYDPQVTTWLLKPSLFVAHQVNTTEESFLQTDSDIPEKNPSIV
jgi:hypothetical protein